MDAKEKLFWSIALPGFGQLLNRKYVKGLLFVVLEFIVNVKSQFNAMIIASFHGDIQKAIELADFQWLLFYPCLYFFAMWDAFKDGGGGKEPYSFMPFVFSAYFVTVGTIYSTKVTIFGYLPGPIWLPILSVIPGVLVGLILKKLLTKWGERKN
ncbi:hypothetical protein J14TS2_24030 [Bacillus sp. J14TS2]|uniref:hypothetical protein n=1 Tax=Bacillus sp. J14TS2 TaxID=2807188 RepID=UPI001B1C7B68|nr:hypothetical protein [Bacillus sp. J14TS2]GIN71928.1 hypothetical protein J14TS2_24030 [Bacillus sp. J14TS2]